MSLRLSHRPLLLLLDFPSPHVSVIHRRRHTSTTTTNPSIRNNNNNPPPPAALTPSQKAYLSSALRINQAGELAATHIYTSQTPILTQSHPHLRSLLQHMYTQEASHLATFNALLAQHRIRPSALRPLWIAAARVLGWGTAVMGREAAMACTEAVEREIGGHYNEQVRELVSWVGEMKRRGEKVPEEVEGLVEVIRRIRDEELEHLDHAVDNDARLATAWPVLTAVIRGGCRGAIWVCGKV